MKSIGWREQRQNRVKPKQPTHPPARMHGSTKMRRAPGVRRRKQTGLRKGIAIGRAPSHVALTTDIARSRSRPRQSSSLRHRSIVRRWGSQSLPRPRLHSGQGHRPDSQKFGDRSLLRFPSSEPRRAVLLCQGRKPHHPFRHPAIDTRFGVSFPVMILMAAWCRNARMARLAGQGCREG